MISFWIPFKTILMQRHCFQKPPFCLWRGKNVHTKQCEYQIARQIWLARLPGWIQTTHRSLTAVYNVSWQLIMDL